MDAEDGVDPQCNAANRNPVRLVWKRGIERLLREPAHDDADGAKDEDHEADE
jgi:hypothetical protein